MNIHWANKLVHPDVFPNAKINTCCVFSYHPAEVHIEAFAGRIITGGRDGVVCFGGYVMVCMGEFGCWYLVRIWFFVFGVAFLC